jgi:hypothetical protein
VPDCISKVLYTILLQVLCQEKKRGLKVDSGILCYVLLNTEIMNNVAGCLGQGKRFVWLELTLGWGRNTLKYDEVVFYLHRELWVIVSNRQCSPKSLFHRFGTLPALRILHIRVFYALPGLVLVSPMAAMVESSCCYTFPVVFPSYIKQKRYLAIRVVFREYGQVPAISASAWVEECSLISEARDASSARTLPYPWIAFMIASSFCLYGVKAAFTYRASERYVK